MTTKMAGYDKLKAWMDEKYGVSKSEITITYNGKTYTGHMYGNDECFEDNEFYQYFLTDDALLRMYFHIPDGCTDLGSASIDYDAPYDVAVDDAQYWISMIMLYSR